MRLRSTKISTSIPPTARSEEGSVNASTQIDWFWPVANQTGRLRIPIVALMITTRIRPIHSHRQERRPAIVCLRSASQNGVVLRAILTAAMVVIGASQGAAQAPDFSAALDPKTRDFVNSNHPAARAARCVGELAHEAYTQQDLALRKKAEERMARVSKALPSIAKATNVPLSTMAGAMALAMLPMGASSIMPGGPRVAREVSAACVAIAEDPAAYIEAIREQP